MTTKKLNPIRKPSGRRINSLFGKIPEPELDMNTVEGQLRLEIKELKATNKALNDECRAPRMTEQEIEESRRLRTEHDRAYADINALAMWLRTNKATEIARGDHNGRSLADVVIGYLAKGLILENIR